MTAAHATDYTWFEQRYPVLDEAYCLTLVEGIAADELLRRFDALTGQEVTGLAAVVAAWEAFDDGEDGDEEDDDWEDEAEEEAEKVSDLDEDRVLVAVTELDGWAIAVEPYGYLGSLSEVISRLSEGTRLVSHFRNVNAVDHFNWWERDSCRLQFEPLFPDQRHGNDADAPGIPELLMACGFRLDGERGELHTEAAFALAERLTDVRLTPERLEAATFRLGYAPRP
ncbi:DUF6461 domain-containing protein [Kitasatospora sp. NPDC058162]|uniref:DUF6461 domain-containing protein n=1 Tax=Kitasatospora sp. NPDC058162 TaxID=3346362 RepID=UPI0036DB1AB4